MKTNLLAISVRNLIATALSNGFALIMSGYINATGEDKTDELAAHIALTYRKYQPIIVPTHGLWEGTAERSLLVIFTDKSVQASLVGAAFDLCKLYSQHSAIVALKGAFYSIGADGLGATYDHIGSDYKTEFNPDAVQGYTVAYIGESRKPENELFRFTI
jgi:hypothetical protein